MRGETARYWDGRHVMYRYWDKRGRLLYIGATSHVLQRHYEHSTGATGAWWFPLVTKMRVQVFPTRGDALEAERLAIQDERPLFNTKLTGRKDSSPYEAWTPADHRLHRTWDCRGSNYRGWWLPRAVAR